MTDLDVHNQLVALVKADLGVFIKRAFKTLIPAERLVWDWYLDAIAHALERVARGEVRRLIITVPPRHLKSICTSVSLVAWMLGQDPSLKFLVASYGSDLAGKHARDFRAVIESEWYRAAFPEAGTPVRNADGEVVLRAGGGRKAVSLGGSATGFGADVIIIDDLMKAADATSAVERDRVKLFYEQTLLSRFNNIADGRVIVIQQRLHEDDLVGMLLEKGGFEHLNLPAIAMRDEVIALPRGRSKSRKIGEVLSSRNDREILDRLKQEIGNCAFSAQYQQDPSAPDGNVIRWSKFKTFDAMPERDRCTFIVQSWDTAATAGPSSAYSVGTTWGYHERAWKLLDLHRVRLDYPDLLDRVRFMRDQWKADLLVIEAASSGHGLIADLDAERRRRPFVRRRVGESVGWAIRSFSPTTDKHTRMATQAAKLESGQAMLPQDAPWLEELRREIVAMPNGRYEDQIDSISQFLELSPGIMTNRTPGRPRIRQR